MHCTFCSCACIVVCLPYVSVYFSRSRSEGSALCEYGVVICSSSSSLLVTGSGINRRTDGMPLFLGVAAFFVVVVWRVPRADLLASLCWLASSLLAAACPDEMVGHGLLSPTVLRSNPTDNCPLSTGISVRMETCRHATSHNA